MALLMWEVLREFLAYSLESMTRILWRSRRLMAVSILFLLAGVVVLSAATRKPCLRVCTGSWHIWKAGHMTKSEGQETCKLRATAEAEVPQNAAEESPAPLPSIYFSLAETVPPTNSIVDQIRHFRSPPTVG